MHVNCQNGIIEQLFDSLTITWSENSALRKPSDSAPALASEVVYKLESDGQTF
jgi:hypothetical protein